LGCGVNTEHTNVGQSDHSVAHERHRLQSKKTSFRAELIVTHTLCDAETCWANRPIGYSQRFPSKTKGLFVTQQDVSQWLGLVCVALAMISFRWGKVAGAVSLLLASALLTAATMAVDDVLPETGLAVLLLIAAVAPASKRKTD
jgi:hypothetical protein